MCSLLENTVKHVKRETPTFIKSLPHFRMEEYLKRTKVWRGKNKSQLLLSLVKPHNIVVSSTISGWIKNVLREAVIDTKSSKGHSTC